MLPVSDELDSAYTSDAALYNPFLDSDPELNDQDSDQNSEDGQISDSEADRVMINYTEHFDGSIGRTSDDIREDLEEEELEESFMMPVSVLPESEQGEDEMYFEELEERMEVRFMITISVTVMVFSSSRSLIFFIQSIYPDGVCL